MPVIHIALTFLISLAIANEPGTHKTCSIDGHERVIMIGNSLGRASSAIKATDCPENVQSAYLNLIAESNGTLNQRLLSEALSTFGTQALLVQNKIHISRIEDLLKAKIPGQKNFVWTDSRLITQDDAIALSSNENIELQCSQCLTPGEKSIKVVIKDPFTNDSRMFLLSAKLQIRTQALVAKRAIAPNSGALNPSDFVMKEVLTTQPELFFSDRPRLAFFKSNKPLADGSALKSSDLSAIYLVQAGKSSNVSFKNQSFSLSASAIPMQSGHQGDVIQLRNPTTGKTISGRVVDFDKVEIEL
jgi:flagella basal body P-ring formation protein FlgA